MKAINRIYQYFAYKKIKPTRFEKEIGISNGYFGTQLKRKSNLGEGILNKILTNCLDLNPSWLLTGQGDMLKEELEELEGLSVSRSEVGESPLAYRVSSQRGIPLIPFERVVSWDAREEQAIAQEGPRYIVPEFDELKIDFMLRIKGDDMYPKYNNGDLLACRKLPSNTFFQWNKVYVLTTVQGVMVKRIEKSQLEEHISCVSDNAKYHPFELSLKEIHSLALVLSVIHF